MTPTQHTPGPWETCTTNSEQVYAANGLRVADCHCDGQEDDMSSEQEEANARLIKAAPDMLEALAFIADDIEEGVRASGAWHRIARAAIAKATA